MNTRRSAVVFLSLSSLALFVSAQDPAPLAPKIVCDEIVYDFGERDNTETLEHHYLIRNEGSLSLEIRGVRATCGCTAVKPQDDLVPPGGETKIQVRLDLRGRSGMQIKTISVLSNDPLTPQLNLQMRGQALQALRAQPSPLFFGRLGPGAVRTRPFEILSDRGSVEILEFRAEHPGIRLTALDPEPGDEGRRHRFEVTLEDSLPGGTLNSQIVVLADQNGQKQLVIPVAAYIEAPPPAP